jgi:nitrite reductase/ring-hydroxylating ferredoxin subunit
VYDRNAPHICPENNTTLEVKDNISVVCPKDNATWILITGQPTAGASVPPKTYPYNFDANSKVLNIYY